MASLWRGGTREKIGINRRLCSAFLNLCRVKDEKARGFAIGVAAHGIGAARGFQESERTGAFAGIGMGLNGLATAIIAPLIVAWLL